ncbi:helix-turn-helix domain-containing protein [Clostridium senegalense]|uniref:Transcriptional regulator n=1 Tax=Clostridium senegalense TaxID=1465809 RepID=A0A6M0H0A9_9CLOT|nr:transcriptional regulator [Clostridium senegalense]NEU03618.1 transcriptional regulator [Clostridium senegalense]
MIFPEDLKRIRQRCFLTQNDFAKEVQVAFLTVNKWEGGKVKSNLSAMKNIKEFCLKNDIEYSGLEEAWLDYEVKKQKPWKITNKQK